MAEWGRRLLARKGELRLVVAALARKLLVSIWYLLMGKSQPVEGISAPPERQDRQDPIQSRRTGALSSKHQPA